MGQKDLAAKKFFGKKDVFADLVNYYFFQGEQIVEPEDLLDRDTEAILANLESGKLKAKYRDLFKQVAIKADARATYVLIGIENQAEVDYTMPIRVLIYDALEYERQLLEATIRHKGEQPTDVIGLLKGDTRATVFKPVITLVVYLGSGIWTGPRSLHDSLNSIIPEKMSKYINNWQVPIIEPAKMQEGDLNSFATELGLVMKFLKYCHDKESLLEAVRNDAGFANISGEALGVMNSVSKHKLKLVGNSEEGGYNMCKAIDDLIKDSIAMGEARGETRGALRGKEEQAKETALTMGRDGMPSSVIAKYIHVNEAKVKEWLQAAAL